MKCCQRALPLWGGLLLLAACQQQTEMADTMVPPPVGHYEGSIKAGQLAETRAALDIRHPSPGHYEAELSVPDAGNLSFVADTILFANKQLRLVRPGQPTQVLTLVLDGDFWRGTLALDEVKAEALLVKRGPPTPSTYRVEELPQAQGSAWLYAPADTGTPGPALVLLPDSTTLSAAPLWADALAREGIIVLVLPVADSTTGLKTAQQLLRTTPGADTATVGVWAAGRRATALARELATGGWKPAFFIAQNALVVPGSKAVFRQLMQQEVAVLGLYGGQAFNSSAATLRAALASRRGGRVLLIRPAGANLLVPGGLGPLFGPGLPGAVIEWLRER
jgi:hypothetical protein